MRPLISIIIPIYNTGIYLKRCLESVINQNLKEIEIILIDDGSTDISGEICDQYARRDKRIKVIHKKNEGVSIARNEGIREAQGEYIAFIDSDDWIEPNMYESMYNKATLQNCEIVICDAITVWENNNTQEDTIVQLKQDCHISRDEVTPKLLTEIAGSAWRCIYKNTIIQEHQLIFPIGLKFSEDRIFNIYAIGLSTNIYYIKKPFYNRVMRKGSAVNKYYINMFDIAKDVLNRTYMAIDRAWNNKSDFIDIYKEQIVQYGLMAIYNEFHRDCNKTLREKYLTIKMICNDKELVDILNTTQELGGKSNLIKNRRYLTLCAIAWGFNIKNRQLR